MNNLPQNELLSAYLDGELTADEQAEVERLLAADPAARQLLDELRTLSAALQSLPQQKLGEDLSERVLQVAARRMLTEGEPGEAATSPTAPMPLARSIFSRFLNRRALVWTGMAVAIAVMIAVHEREQRALIADKNNRELAVLVAKETTTSTTDKTVTSAEREEVARKIALARKPGPPPTIQAAPEPTAEGAKGERKAPTEESLDRKTAGSDKSAEMPTERISPKSRFKLENYGQPSKMQFKGSAGSVAPARASSQPATTPFAPQVQIGRGEPTRGKIASFDSKAGVNNWSQSKQSAAVLPDVLVVFCDVTPEAIKKKAFDKLLDENGIVGRRHSVRKDNGLANGDKPADNAHNAVQEAVKQQSAGEEMFRRTIAADGAELVYIEATPIQVKATLDALAAQPTMFISVSVKPAQDRSAQQVVRYFAGRRGGIQGKSADDYNFSGFGGEGRQENQQAEREFSANSAGSAVANAPKSAAPKGDAATLGGRDKAGAGAAPAGGQLGETASKVEREANGTQPPNAAPFAARGNLPPAPAPGFGPSPASKPQTQTEKARQQPAPTELQAGQERGGPTQQPDGQWVAPSQSLALLAPRQRVLFVLRVSSGLSPAAAEVRGQPGHDAAKSPPVLPAAPVPSK